MIGGPGRAGFEASASLEVSAALKVSACPEVSAEVGVIGGSGFYHLIDDAATVDIDTPYGAPSGRLTVGEVEGTDVAFVARHGETHQWPPHRVNYRANLWALRSVGVRRVIAPAAVGSLRSDLAPGDFVVLDQLVDRTSGRPDTFVDGPPVHHVGFADPYCPDLGAALVSAAGGVAGLRIHAGGTVVVIQGPRFSTRAESRWFRAAGWDVVNMTQYPEAALARELGMCYAGLALVTDYDTGVGDTSDAVSPGAGSDAVSMAAVMAVMAGNVERTRSLLRAAIPTLASDPACACRSLGAPGVGPA